MRIQSAHGYTKKLGPFTLYYDESYPPIISLFIGIKYKTGILGPQKLPEIDQNGNIIEFNDVMLWEHEERGYGKSAQIEKLGDEKLNFFYQAYFARVEELKKKARKMGLDRNQGLFFRDWKPRG